LQKFEAALTHPSGSRFWFWPRGTVITGGAWHFSPRLPLTARRAKQVHSSKSNRVLLRDLNSQDFCRAASKT